MNDEIKKCECKPHGKQVKSQSEALYGLGVIGALVYFLPRAVGFKAIMWALVKSVGWPAVIVHRVLEMLQL